MADVYLKDVLPVSGEVGDLKVGGDITLEAFQDAGNDGLALVLNAGKLELASGTFITESDVQALSVSAPVLDSARIGTATGEVDIDEDGVELIGGAVVWDDMRTSPMAANHSGANPPVLEIVANDGSATTGYAVDMDGNDDKITVPYYSDMNVETMSINVWLNPDTVNSIEIVDRDASNIFEFYVNNGAVYFKVNGSTVSTSSNVMVAGQTQMVTVTVNAEGSNTRVKIYVNKSLQEERVVNALLPTTNNTDGYIIGEYTSGGWNYEGVMDGLYIYNVQLSQSQIDELYNDGAGTTSHPTGITEATDVIAKFDFNEGTGTVADNNSTLGAGYDGTLVNGVLWVDGLMGVTSGSIGVMALSFPPDQVTEIFGSVQFSHKYKEGTTVYPHVHWKGEDTSAGDVVWKLEYMWINIGDSVTTTTTIVSRTVANDTVALTHRMNDVPSAGLDGTGKQISSIIQYRLYRDGNDAADTYAKKVYLSEFDVHFQIDTMGSRTTMAK